MIASDLTLSLALAAQTLNGVVLGALLFSGSADEAALAALAKRTPADRRHFPTAATSFSFARAAASAFASELAPRAARLIVPLLSASVLLNIAACRSSSSVVGAEGGLVRYSVAGKLFLLAVASHCGIGALALTLSRGEDGRLQLRIPVWGSVMAASDKVSLVVGSETAPEDGPSSVVSSVAGHLDLRIALSLAAAVGGGVALALRLRRL